MCHLYDISFDELISKLSKHVSTPNASGLCVNPLVTHTGLRDPLEIVVWTDDNFNNNFGNKKDVTKYINRSCS